MNISRLYFTYKRDFLLKNNFFYKPIDFIGIICYYITNTKGRFIYETIIHLTSAGKFPLRTNVLLLSAELNR